MAVTDRAIERIQELIRAGDLPPGSRLAPENELAAQLGIGRSSIREAVKALELIRVLDVRHGDGTYVTSLEPHLLLEGVGFAIDLVQGDAILEVVEIRRLFEPIATGLAAERIDDAALERLAEYVAAMEQAGNDQERLVQSDHAFHSTVFEARRALQPHLPRPRLAWRDRGRGLRADDSRTSRDPPGARGARPPTGRGSGAHARHDLGTLASGRACKDAGHRRVADSGRETPTR
jgi:DNA-binding GntR family transcriptional regulator